MKPKYFIATAFTILCVFLLVLFSMTGEDTPVKQGTQQAANIVDQQKTVEKKAAPGTDPTPPNEKQTIAGNANETVKAAKVEKTVIKPDGVAAFDEWLDKYLAADQKDLRELITEGVALAELRKPVMEQLIKTDPQAALQSAVSYYEYEQLPEMEERITSYMVKATREAKVHTNWINHNTSYENWC